MSTDLYTIQDLLSIMEQLRAPGGCPWDREQTHLSIRKNFLEEVYEVLEAIDENDSVLLQEELGDVLLQVVFHAQMEKEAGRFTFADVCDGICRKLIERHPHVFGNLQVADSREVLRNWEDIKTRSKKQDTVASTLQSVPKVLPALMRAQKIQHRAGKGGFSYPTIDGALTDLQSELGELLEAISQNDKQHIGEELGDVLFAVVNVCRMAELDAEECLSLSTDKFQNRVCRVEEIAAAKGKRTAELSLAELDVLWKRVKAKGEPDVS